MSANTIILTKRCYAQTVFLRGACLHHTLLALCICLALGIQAYRPLDRCFHVSFAYVPGRVKEVGFVRMSLRLSRQS